MKFVLVWLENMVGKGENTVYIGKACAIWPFLIIVYRLFCLPVADWSKSEQFMKAKLHLQHTMVDA